MSDITSDVSVRMPQTKDGETVSTVVSADF